MTVFAIDSNLLLLLIVGDTRLDFVEKHKRTRAFDQSDHALLSSLLKGATSIVTTPHSLTEVSNLLRQGVVEPLKSRLVDRFHEFISAANEHFEEAVLIVEQPVARRLGLADTSWLAALEKEVRFLTVDVDLHDAALAAGIDVVNFNHLRDERLSN